MLLFSGRPPSRAAALKKAKGRASSMGPASVMRVTGALRRPARFSSP